mmetsp:Transcript_11471/g.15798  ORF Transcript_11471/g.15798 Transcript_11471/m.15798 type:complete len:792 (-) Transcript_11471:85-2460(-)
MKAMKALLLFIFLICLFRIYADDPTASPSTAPTRAPTTTRSPSTKSPNTTRAPTKKPVAPIPNIYGKYQMITLDLDVQQGIVAALTILLFIFMAMEITGPEVLFLIALMIVTLAQILTLTEALSGFANDSMITIGTLFLVVGAVEKSHCVDWLARKTFGSEGSLLLGKARMYCMCFALSIFFNNTPLVAILLPVVKDWGRLRNIAASQLLMPLSFSVLAGSFVSMIGTSTNLTVQGLMQADRGYSFPFFAPAPFGISCFAIILVYQLIFGPIFLPTDKSGLIRGARDNAKHLIAEVFVSEHSPAVGRTLGTMMNSLGVAPSFAIKIRRRANNQPEDAAILRKNRSTSVLDVEYLKKSAHFWFKAPEIPRFLGDYSSVVASETGEGEKEVNGEQDEYIDIVAPSINEIIVAEDVVFISSAQDAVEKMMKSIMGESRGMYILKSNVLALPGFGTEVLECVLSDSNPFIGRPVNEVSVAFAERYNIGVITVRAKDWGSFSGEDDADKSSGNDTKAEVSSNSITEAGIQMVDQSEPKDERSSETKEDAELIPGLKSISISNHVLGYGDVVLCVANEKDVDKLAHNRDFFVVSTVGALPKPLTLYSLIPLLVFIVLLILVASEFIEMCPAALTVTAFFFMGGWIKPEEIPVMVDIRLLMLMGCSLSFAKAMTKSGLALRIAVTISSSNPSNFGALLLIYAITLVITELISNNAAAALMYPIAVALADELHVSFKPFAMAVLISSTAGFMSPIGYQTHVMVWGPGGYRFKDFLIFGFVPDVVYWFLGCALVPLVFPF